MISEMDSPPALSSTLHCGSYVQYSPNLNSPEFSSHSPRIFCTREAYNSFSQMAGHASIRSNVPPLSNGLYKSTTNVSSDPRRAPQPSGHTNSPSTKARWLMFSRQNIFRTGRAGCSRSHTTCLHSANECGSAPRERANMPDGSAVPETPHCDATTESAARASTASTPFAVSRCVIFFSNRSTAASSRARRTTSRDSRAARSTNPRGTSNRSDCDGPGHHDSAATPNAARSVALARPLSVVALLSSESRESSRGVAGARTPKSRMCWRTVRDASSVGVPSMAHCAQGQPRPSEPPAESAM